MHELVAPATNLFYNAEVSARRYPRQALPGVLRHGGDLRGISRRGRARRGISRAALRGAQGRSGAAAHAEQPAVRHRLLRHPARQRRRGAAEPHEPDAGNPALRAGRGREHHAGVAGTVSRASSRCSRAGDSSMRSSRPIRIICRQPTTLAVPDFVAAPRIGHRRTGVDPVERRARRRLAAGPADGGAGRSVRDALYLRHHGPAQGLHAHAPHRHAHDGRRHALVCAAARD